MNSFERQMQNIVDKMHKHIDDVAKVEMINGLRQIIDIALRELDGFEDVTGNTKNSLAAAVFYDGKFQGFYSSYGALHNPPTRATLRKDETYDLEYYWDGTPVDAFARPYTGETGDESYWAQDEAREFFSDNIPTRKGWCYMIVAAVDYAKYLEARGGVNVLSDLHDEFAARGADVSELKNG